MKILLITPEYPPYGSGISNAVFMIQKYMLKEGIHVDVLTRQNKGVFGLPGLSGLIPFWLHVTSYASKIYRKYDAIWLHSPIFMNPKLSHAIRMLITFHSTYHGFYNACKLHGIYNLLPYYLLAANLEHSFLKYISRLNNITVTAVSPSVAKELSLNGLKRTIYVNPNGFDLCNLRVNTRESSRDFLLKNYLLCLPKEDFVLLYVGRITEIKQPLHLINLFKEIVNQIPNIRLVILGSGNLFTKLKKKARPLDSVHILGHIPHKEIHNFMRAADAFISLSCYEGFPLAVIEAASHGLPLILSNTASHKWILESGIGSGILVNSRKPELNKVINFIMRCSKANSFRFIEDYSWTAIIRKYISLMQ
jgi:glycosyltransferase involved in cell wall biosynthesis